MKKIVVLCAVVLLASCKTTETYTVINKGTLYKNDVEKQILVVANEHDTVTVCNKRAFKKYKVGDRIRTTSKVCEVPFYTCGVNRVMAQR